jgi:hypothetical protein
MLQVEQVVQLVRPLLQEALAHQQPQVLQVHLVLRVPQEHLD